MDLSPGGILLWKTDKVSCACVHVAQDHIQIILLVDGTQVHVAEFSDADAASQFAVEKMNAYGAR